MNKETGLHMPKLHILITSTRPTRVGPAIATWLEKKARDHGGFETELVDLASFSLPVFDESEHPLKQLYEHDHTKNWAAKVSEADAFIFVLPEYDYFTPAALVNAIQFLSKEWNYKPLGLASYSTGISGGLRSAQTTKLLVTSVKMMPMAETLAIPFLNQYMTESGEFTGNELFDASAQKLLDELLRWTNALKTLRS